MIEAVPSAVEDVEVESAERFLATVGCEQLHPPSCAATVVEIEAHAESVTLEVDWQRFLSDLLRHNQQRWTKVQAVPLLLPQDDGPAFREEILVDRDAQLCGQLHERECLGGWRSVDLSISNRGREGGEGTDEVYLCQRSVQDCT